MSTFRNEPLFDFSRDANRRGMEEALAKAHRSGPRRCPLLIDGEWVATDATALSHNPSEVTETIAQAAQADAALTEAAIQAARRAFPAWAAAPVHRRAEILRGAAEQLRRRRMEINAIETLEAGKPWHESDADVCEAIDFLEYYAREMVALETPVRLMEELPGEVNELTHSALGITAVIAPWNFPLAIPTGMAAAAFVAGNAVILKPAEQTPLCAQYLAEALVAAGAPRGAFQVLHGPGERVGAELVRRPEIDLIAFTGSRSVGLEILRESAAVREGQWGIRRAILELGGKNAIIVDETADLDATIPDIIHSAFGFAGQKCSACSRLIVLDAVHDALVERLQWAAESLIVAPAEDPSAQMGPLIEEAAAERLRGAIARGRREGEVLHVGDLGGLDQRGHFVPPAIIGGLASDHPLAQEELFGPFLAVLRAGDFSEALAIAKATPYALTGGLHTRTPAHVERARREYEVGNLYINRGITGAIVGRQPFGGFRFSGVGSKAGGPDYLRQFVLPRTITENTMRHGFAPLEEAG